MQNNPIINKYCYVKQKTGKAYCFKCGKLLPILPRDTYNMKKHALEDHFAESDFVEIFTEGEDYVCGWKKLEAKDQYGFVVYTPQLVPRAGFTVRDEKFQGGKWKAVYKCIFHAGKRKILEQIGSESRVDDWAKYEMPYLNKLEKYQTIYQMFHIPGYRNFQEFVNIFRKRGFQYQELLTEEEAREVLNRPIVVAEEEFNEDYFAMKAGEIYAQVIPVEHTAVFRLDIRFYDKARRNCKLLIGDHYFFSDDEIELEYLLKQSFRHVVSSEDLELFALYNQDTPLMSYWGKSKHNLLIPLFAAVWSEGLMALVERGCAVAANYYLLRKELQEPETQGFPTEILCRVSDEAFRDWRLFDTLNEVCKKVPEYLGIQKITPMVLQYLQENVLAEYDGRRTAIEEFKTLDAQLKLQIAEYLSEEDASFLSGCRDYQTYIKYLNLTLSQRGENFEYLPERLNEAYQMEWDLRLRYSEIGFAKCVCATAYKLLESDYGKEAKLFEEDRFFVRAPKTRVELESEQEVLQNDVEISANEIIDGGTKVYFLRLKKASDLPLCVIHVVDGRAIKLRTYFNEKPYSDVLKFVYKWSKIKKVELCGDDFIM